MAAAPGTPSANGPDTSLERVWRAFTGIIDGQPTFSGVARRRSTSPTVTERPHPGLRQLTVYAHTLPGRPGCTRNGKPTFGPGVTQTLHAG